MEMTDHIVRMLDYYRERSIILAVIMRYWEQERIEEYMPFAAEELEKIEKKYKKGGVIV